MQQNRSKSRVSPSSCFTNLGQDSTEDGKVVVLGLGAKVLSGNVVDGFDVWTREVEKKPHLAKTATPSKVTPVTKTTISRSNNQYNNNNQ